jgi:hypothetical protein
MNAALVQAQQEFVMSVASLTAKTRRLRPAAPHGRGGASSLLRLSRAATALPSGSELTGWMTRAGSLLEPPSDGAPILSPLAARSGLSVR